MVKRLAFAATAALLSFGIAGAAQATLIGQTVGISVTGPDAGTPNQTSATVTTGGPEFVIALFADVQIGIDVQESFIDFQYSGSFGANFGTTGQLFTISGLTWAPDPGGITGATVTEFEDPNGSGTLPFGPNTASFTASSITLNVRGIWEDQDRVRVDFTTDDITQLPEPATLTLLGFGLLGLGFAALRRRQEVLGKKGTFRCSRDSRLRRQPRC